MNLKMGKFLFSVIYFLYLTYLVQSSCSIRTKENDTISDSYTVFGRDQYYKCWEIVNPEKYDIHLQMKEWPFEGKGPTAGDLTVSLRDENKNYFLWDGPIIRNITTDSSSVLIRFIVNSSNLPDNYISKFTLSYTMDIDVLGKNIGKARGRAVSSLISRRTPLWGWQENTPRAITALYLANGANFNRTSKEEELMAKQNDLKTAIALLKNPISNEQLSAMINSLLVTCRNPNHFYGQNLVKRLKEQSENSENTVHPIVYLTLCNANESWPSRAPSDLKNVFNSTADYHFVKDIQAYAVMALSCYANNSNFLNNIENFDLLPQVRKSVETFKEHQLKDGSFGNIETTALITQALISRGEEDAEGWKMNATIKYLIRELNVTDVDFTKLYLTLPVLNGKSLTDVYKVNCTGTRKRIEDDLISEVKDYVGPKMRIRYSLFIGDEKDIIHTLSIRVPENYTAHEVMQYAGEEDYKYKFEEKKISGKVYVSKIGRVSNDPESGKFWLLYLESANSTHYNHTTTSPDHIKMNDEDHLIMWFKTALI